jgi:biopolymer transport protein ExbB/TolQ
MTDFHYIFIESLRNTYEAGGVVMLPILLSGVVGFYFLFSSWFRIGSDFFRKDITKVVRRMQRGLTGERAVAGAESSSDEQRVQMTLTDLRKRGGFLSRELSYAIEIAQKNYDEFRDYMQVRMMKSVRYMEQGNHIVSVMAAAAPLLGLLGTVTGMVSTFEVITLYGNQNPVLMADGISEALISTQSGLLIAFPLTLMKQRLDERIEILKQEMELGATVIDNYFATRAGQRHCEP